MTSRQRSQSAREEGLIDKFVAATVDFKSNVSFAEAVPANLAQRILVLLPEDASKAQKPAFWNPEFESLAGEAGVGALHGTNAKVGEQSVRVMVGVVPQTASRHNCPTRPDSITTLVQAALGSGKKDQPLDIFSALPAGAEIAIAQAVAKGANRSFTAKGGKWEASFFQAGVPVRLIFNTLKNAESLQAIADGVQLAMRLGDAPPCLLDTTTFAEIAAKYAAKYGFQWSEIRGEELREKGYGGAYGVGKAAEFPPALVTLTYKPKEGISPKDKIALVGKGIIYDTGGLSIKTPSTFMSGMKMDMCGAGAVFSGFVTLVRMNAPYEITATLCLADNAVGPRSQRPDDIIIMKSGVSIEVANTDAEGRLVMADGVYHITHEIPNWTPSVVIDMATLTGAQLVTTGKKIAACFTTSEEWENRFVAAGRKCGDLVFPIVYCPEFHNPQYESKVADYKNLSERGNGDSSCAGQFMTNNLPKDFKGAHVHIDLAGPAMGAEVATGFGVALLAQIFGQE